MSSVTARCPGLTENSSHYANLHSTFLGLVSAATSQQTGDAYDDLSSP
jgi:hypothetical protein